MLRAFFCILLALQSSISSAAEIHAVDGGDVILLSTSSSRSDFRQVVYCDAQSCQKYPSDEVVLAMSFGGTITWEEIFQQCRNFESLNDLLFYTEIVSSLAVFAKPAVALRNLRSTKNLLASWGIFGRVAGNRFVFDAGVVIAGDTILSLPESIPDTGMPYPEISESDVDAVSALAEGLLSEGNEVYYLPRDFVKGLATVIAGCTSQLEENVVEMGYLKQVQQFYQRREAERANLRLYK